MLWQVAGQVVWPAVVTLLLLGPALFPGYLLRYDMVWVPDLGLRSDFLGLGSGIPRAVPSDAWVAVLDEVIPGMVLQKVMLAGSLIAGGVGIQRWVREVGIGRAPVNFAGTAAASAYIWNPYVVERIGIGHWPMLVCYGVLPWLALLVARSVRDSRIHGGLLVLLPVASLNASAGIAAALVVAAFAIGSPAALIGRLGLVALGANLPWITAGLAKADVLQSVDTAASVFAPAGEGSLPLPLTALTLGGIWNVEVVPASRTSVLAWLSVTVVVISVVAGWRWLRQRVLLGWWLVGLLSWALAVMGWLVPDAVDGLASVVPGAGVLRDGSRLLLLLAPLLALALAALVARVMGRLGEAAPVVAVFCILIPLALLPDAAWGAFGRWQPVDYPDSYAAMKRAVAETGTPGEVLVLPFTAYRAPDWNHGRKVFDPVGRYQDRNHLASDNLVVSGDDLGGEDPRGEEVLRVLRLETPQARASGLAEMGIGVVVTDLETAGQGAQQVYSATVSGDRTVVGDAFEVVGISGARRLDTPAATLVAVTLGWGVHVGLIGAGLVLVARSRMRHQSG